MLISYYVNITKRFLDIPNKNKREPELNTTSIYLYIMFCGIPNKKRELNPASIYVNIILCDIIKWYCDVN